MLEFFKSGIGRHLSIVLWQLGLGTRRPVELWCLKLYCSGTWQLIVCVHNQSDMQSRGRCHPRWQMLVIKRGDGLYLCVYC